MCNRVLLENIPERSIYQYHVDFAPPIESIGYKKKLIYGELKDLLGEVRIFDGTQLFLPKLLNNGKVSC